MSPAVRQAVVDQSGCTHCGASAGKPCISLAGRRLPHVHQARVHSNLFDRRPRT